MLLVCLSLAASTQAQNFTPAQEKSNRWEGLLPEFNAEPKFQVRGFLGSLDVADASPRSELSVRFYLPPGDTVAHLEALEVDDLKNYHMKSKPESIRGTPGSWASFSQWPVGDVLAPSGIAPSKLGILVVLRDPKIPNLYAPAFFYTSRVPTQVGSYTIYLSSDHPVTRLRCAVRDRDGNAKNHAGVPYPCLVPPSASIMTRSVPGQFKVPSAGLPTGLVSVTILGDYLNDESGAGLRTELHFFHQPQLKLP